MFTVGRILCSRNTDRKSSLFVGLRKCYNLSFYSSCNEWELVVEIFRARIQICGSGKQKCSRRLSVVSEIPIKVQVKNRCFSLSKKLIVNIYVKNVHLFHSVTSWLRHAPIFGRITELYIRTADSENTNNYTGTTHHKEETTGQNQRS